MVIYLFSNNELRLTTLETYLIVSDGLSDIEMQDPIIDRSDGEIEIDTPKPKKAFEWSENEAEDLPYNDSDDFKTPKTLEKALKTKAQLLADGSDVDLLDERLEKAFQRRAQLLAAGSDIDSTDRWNTDQGVRTDIESDGVYESEAGKPQARTQTTTKRKDPGNRRTETTKKEKRAFRKEVEERRGQLPITAQVRLIVSSWDFPLLM